MNSLTPQEVSHLARLARLNLTEEELGRYAEQLTNVVAYIDQLSAIKTENDDKPLTGVSGLINILAIDQPRLDNDLCAVPSADLLSGVPRTDGRYIEVRAVMVDEVVSP